ncbi:hypothetical protein GCM10023171_33750 [Microbacterium panaciterrae]|uniref:DUF222 domain-containing protein n=1 Tax=Microbacterium panaciterrae TaxID=985759 RepID=A0ABP8PSG8_9MICO
MRDGCLPEATLAVYEAACLVVAEQDSPARTRVHARQIAATLAGENLEERHARATAERCVSVKALEDGMALLTVVLPEIYAAAIKDRLSRLAGAIAADTRGETERALGIAFTDPVTDPGATIAAGATFALDPEHDLHDPATDTCAAKKVGPDARREFVAIDGRTRRQIEADVLIDLLLAGSPSEILGSGLENITATVQVTISATTLAGEDDRFAEFDGHGPLPPDVARELARLASGWNRLFLDEGGMITKVDRYTPTAGMKRFLRARDQRCRFPGCHVPAARCQIDHNHDFACGGTTDLGNLSCFCSAHHPLKHPDLDDEFRWYARQLDDGTVEWISPTGRIYADPPPRRVMFVCVLNDRSALRARPPSAGRPARGSAVVWRG